MLPFSRQQFFDILHDYNADFGSVSWLAYGLAVLCLGSTIADRQHGWRFCFAALAAMWTWTGLVYHLVYFTRINSAAWIFATLFIVEAVILAGLALSPKSLPKRWRDKRQSIAGWALVIYSLVIYPAVGLLAGEPYADLPRFGVTPCPLTLFTFGVLLLLPRPIPWALIIIPLAWSLIGGSAAFLLGVPQDWLLLLSGLLTAAMIGTKPRRSHTGEDAPLSG